MIGLRYFMIIVLITLPVMMLGGGILLGINGVSGWGWLIFLSLFYVDYLNVATKMIKKLKNEKNNRNQNNQNNNQIEPFNGEDDFDEIEMDDVN